MSLTTEEMQQGKFYESVIRNNKQIKADRGQQLLEDSEMSFRRRIEDAERNLVRKRRHLVNMLDLSPENATSLKPVENFDPDLFAETYCSISVEIRNDAIKLNEYKKAYNLLYGTHFEVEEVK